MIAQQTLRDTTCHDAPSPRQRRAYAAMLFRVANDLQAEAEDITDSRLGIETLACADALIAIAKKASAMNDESALSDIEAVHEGRDIEPLVVGGP